MTPTSDDSSGSSSALLCTQLFFRAREQAAQAIKQQRGQVFGDETILNSHAPAISRSRPSKRSVKGVL